MLKQILIANAASCLGFGALFLLRADATARTLGSAPVIVLQILGAGLLVNGLHLLWAARQDHPSRPLVHYFAAGDAAWVLGTLALLANGIWITTILGTILALSVAGFVAACGLGQIRYAPKTAAP